jgi:hypothetical protein
MFSLGSGCPWATTVCAPDNTIDKNTIVCNFGGEDGYDVEAVVSSDGTVLGPAPDFPSSGLGLHRFTGAMTGLWAAVDDTQARTTAVYLIGHDWTDDSLGIYNFPATSDSVGAWQYATGSAKPQQAGVASAADVRLSFNSLSGVGALHGTVRVFRQESTLEDAIGSHACSLEANLCMTNGIPLGCPLFLPVHTVNCVQILKVCSTRPPTRSQARVASRDGASGRGSVRSGMLGLAVLRSGCRPTA